MPAFCRRSQDRSVFCQEPRCCGTGSGPSTGTARMPAPLPLRPRCSPAVAVHAELAAARKRLHTLTETARSNRWRASPLRTSRTWGRPQRRSPRPRQAPDRGCRRTRAWQLATVSRASSDHRALGVSDVIGEKEHGAVRPGTGAAHAEGLPTRSAREDPSSSAGAVVKHN